MHTSPHPEFCEPNKGLAQNPTRESALPRFGAALKPMSLAPSSCQLYVQDEGAPSKQSEDCSVFHSFGSCRELQLRSKAFPL